MSRFLRILFNIMTGLSLLIWLSTVALWIRSYAITDAVERQGPRRMWQTISSSGQVYFAAQIAASPSAVYAPSDQFFHYRSPPGQPLPWTASVGYENYVNTGPFTLAASHAPDWSTLVVRVPIGLSSGLPRCSRLVASYGIESGGALAAVHHVATTSAPHRKRAQNAER